MKKPKNRRKIKRAPSPEPPTRFVVSKPDGAVLSMLPPASSGVFVWVHGLKTATRFLTANQADEARKQSGVKEAFVTTQAAVKYAMENERLSFYTATLNACAAVVSSGLLCKIAKAAAKPATEPILNPLRIPAFYCGSCHKTVYEEQVDQDSPRTCPHCHHTDKKEN